jgi:hypothetical protein
MLTICKSREPLLVLLGCCGGGVSWFVVGFGFLWIVLVRFFVWFSGERYSPPEWRFFAPPPLSLSPLFSHLVL